MLRLNFFLLNECWLLQEFRDTENEHRIVVVFFSNKHFVKSARIKSYSGPHFPAFGVNTERYSVSLRIQSECREMRTKITPNTDTFYAVKLGFLIRKPSYNLILTDRYFYCCNNSQKPDMKPQLRQI